MKYSTINYDSNRPIPNVVKAPLNSDIGVAIKVWKDNKWYNGENYSDYIEIDGESYFGAYFDFTMAGEYTTTFSMKYANE